MAADPFDAAESFMFGLLVRQLDQMPCLRKLETLRTEIQMVSHCTCVFCVVKTFCHVKVGKFGHVLLQV